jgi:mRNA interferase MazF
MKQGEFWFANLDRVTGSEQAGLRPVVIISGNLMIEHLAVVMVVPLTTKVKNYKGNPVLKPGKETGQKAESEMLVFHVRSISKFRLINRVGSITSEEVQLAIKPLNENVRC